MTNIGLYFVGIIKYLEDLFLPKPVFHYFGKGKHILFGILGLALFYQLIRKRSYRFITVFIQEHTILSLGMFFFFGWSFFSIFMIYPNRHYIVLHFCWYLLLLAFLFKNYWIVFDSKILQAGLLILFFVFVPTGIKVSYFHPGSADRDKQPNLSAIRYLLKHDPHKPVKILTPEKGFYAYLPKNYTELFPLKEDINPYKNGKSLDLARFLTEKKIDVIYMNERMQGIIRSSGETTADIIREPEKYGFEKVLIRKNLTAYLLIKNGTF
jgi:hypothetical protein